MKYKKHLKSVIVSALVFTFMLISYGCSGINKAEKSFNNFTEKWAEADYTAMYEMLTNESKEYISEEDFISRYTNIFSAIEAKNLSFEINGDKVKDDNSVTIPFKLTMDTITGNISIDDYKISLVKENGSYKLNWDEGLIFPNMLKDDKLRVSITPAKRGDILDKDGQVLATDGTINTVGIYPANFNKSNAQEKVSEIAKALDISEENITTKLEANTNPEHFIPLVDILPNDTKLNSLRNREEEGIIINSKVGRVYLGGEAFGRLIGYVGNITAEELEANQDKGSDLRTVIINIIE